MQVSFGPSQRFAPFATARTLVEKMDDSDDFELDTREKEKEKAAKEKAASASRLTPKKRKAEDELDAPGSGTKGGRRLCAICPVDVHGKNKWCKLHLRTSGAMRWQAGSEDCHL